MLCNADPKVALRLLDGQDVPADYRERLEAWKVRSPVVKFNAALSALPEWTAAPGRGWPARATIDVTGGLDDAQRAFEACDRGEPAVGFGEIYIQTGYDPSPAPEGRHLLSVFGQYAPYELAHGTWDERRDEVARQFIGLIERFAPGFEDRLERLRGARPAATSRQRIGLTGGNIFQGEVTPDQMWEHRLTPRTPVAGLLPLRRGDAPGRQRDRAQRPQRRAGGAGGRGGDGGRRVTWTILGAPIDSVGRAGGTEHAPRALREHGLVERLGARDDGDLDVASAATCATPRPA